jgi:nitroimidazol reductase NimA-like FMN-containing flavoprotein (pyridoxamine 5'-phosphate oxidase superfamily)
MRRPERALKEKETMEGLLKRTWVGRMATVNREGIPVIKPVHFLYEDGKVYIHSSKKGEKIEDLRRGSPVCFEVDDFIAYGATQSSPCKAHSYYRSVIIKGKGILVREKERKRRILGLMMEKYQPEGGYGEISEESLNQTTLIEISIQEMTGKERLE